MMTPTDHSRWRRLSATTVCAMMVAACDSPPQGTPPEDITPLARETAIASLDEAIARINPAAMIAAIESQPDAFRPDFLIVTNAEHGTPSRAIGMLPGSRALRRGDQWLTRINSPRVAGDLVWVDPRGELHRDPVGEGKAGFWHEPGRSFETWYVRHGQRDERWDLEVVAALAIQKQDAVLAGELWAAAEAKGYPDDQLSCLSRMLIATVTGDAEGAAAFAKAYGPLDQTPDGLPMWEWDWQQVAALTGDPHWLEVSADYFDEKWAGNEMADRHGDLASMLLMAAEDAGTPAAPPSVLADAMSRKTLLKEMDYGAPWCAVYTPISEDFMEMYASATAAHDKAEATITPVRLAVPRDFMCKSWNGPKQKVRDVDMTLRFRVKPLQGSAPCQYLREFHVGLANHDMHGGKNAAQVPPSARILSVCFSYQTSDDPGQSWLNCTVASRDDWTKLWLRHDAFAVGPAPVPAMPDKRPKPGDLHTLRVVRVDGWAEAILDGKRLALVPVPPHLDYPGTHWFISGTEVEVTGYTLDALY